MNSTQKGKQEIHAHKLSWFSPVVNKGQCKL